jgi:hypothetical protein
MAETKIPDPPAGTGPSGLALWREVQERYELEEHERALLTEMVRTVDTLDRLAAIVARDGLMVPVLPLGEKIHPALTEARQLRLALARLSASLRLPAGEEGGDQAQHLRRPQRRGGARGTYGIRGVA